MLRSRSEAREELVNFATHERSTIIREPPVAHRRWVGDLKSASDEHAAAGEPIRSNISHSSVA